MKKIITLLVAIGLGFTSYSQELSCEDFKTGKFYIPKRKKDGSIEKIIIIREGSNQIEFSDEKHKDYELLEWIDNCTYRVKYDSSKMDLSKTQKWIQKNNGIVVEMLSVEGKCINYKAVMTTSKGGKFNQVGKICLE